MKIQAIRPEYVRQLPDNLEKGVLYIAEEFDLTAHKCCCGCGEDVYNKLSPVKWRLIKMRNGRVSLHPSIGNGNYACRSHYWIRENRVIDAGPMSAREIRAARRLDRRDRDRYIAQMSAGAGNRWERTRAAITRVMRQLSALWPW